MALGEILRRAVSLWPEQCAVVCGEHRFSYREVADRVARLAAALAELGITAGDRVAVLHRNCHRMLEAYFACAGLGAIIVPLNHRLTADDLAYILDDTGCGLLLADDGWRDLAAAAVDRAATPCRLIWSRVESDHAPPLPGLDYAELLSATVCRQLADVRVDEHHAAAVYYTSGTTGHHKGVVLTHRNIHSHALATIAELKLDDRDVWAHVAPMFHLADAWATWAMTWIGGRHVMAGCFDPDAVVRLFADERVTLTNLVPTMLNDLVNHPAAGGRELPALRLIMSGGAPISPNLVRRVVECFRTEYVQTYGLTESSPYLSFSLLKDSMRALSEAEQMRYRSMTGRPALGVELKLVDEHGVEVPADGRSVGEIVARGDRITPGYWRLPEATAEAIRDAWLFTGDLATVDGEGFLTIVDRTKDVILSGGELVYSTEVEYALAEHPKVREVAVIAVPDERLGEKVAAVVALRDGVACGDEELIEHCRQRLAHYKCPRQIRFVDHLPRTGSGKINKKALREQGDRFDQRSSG